MATLTADEVRHLLDYDPATGVFRWRVNLGSRARAGQQTGCVSAKGAVVIRLRGQLHYAHRLAWMHVRGAWPSEEIDHINGDPADNRIENLRPASRSENTRNVKMHSRTASRLKGAYRDKKRWASKIQADGRSHHLGCFDTAIEAHRAYRDAAQRLHGAFARFE